MELHSRRAYSYRADPAVPDFDDTHPIAIMDGSCGLCTRGARLIARFDTTGRIRICPAQTPLGYNLLVHYGLNPDDPESWVFLQNGEAHTSLDAMVRAGRHCGWMGRALLPLRLLPRAAQDWLYARIARNRFRFFGRTDMCAEADAGLRARLITGEGDPA